MSNFGLLLATGALLSSCGTVRHVRYQAEPVTNVRVVFVEPEGEQFTVEEQQQALMYVQEALDWWKVRINAIPESQRTISHTVAVAMRIVGTGFITATEQVYISPFTVDTTAVWTVDGIKIFIVDNSSRPESSLRGRVGVAWAPSEAWIVLLGGGPSTVAHELGHLRFGLPDRLPIEPDALVDLMSTPDVAYSMGFLGCATLRDLDVPCTKMYAPIVRMEARNE